MAPMAVRKVAFGPLGELRESGRCVPFNRGRVVEHRHMVKLKLCKCPETFQQGCNDDVARRAITITQANKAKAMRDDIAKRMWLSYSRNYRHV